MTYEELGVFGRLRKIYMCGPVTMYQKLSSLWSVSRQLSPSVIAQKVKKFFYYYSVNRHKMTTITPAYHVRKTTKMKTLQLMCSLKQNLNRQHLLH